MKQKWKTYIMEKFEGDWVRIRELMTNPKNWQMWYFGIQEVKLGIGSSMKEYAKWYYVGYSEVSSEMELNQEDMAKKQMICDDFFLSKEMIGGGARKLCFIILK